jgi:hypothetical protein
MLQIMSPLFQSTASPRTLSGKEKILRMQYG